MIFAGLVRSSSYDKIIEILNKDSSEIRKCIEGTSQSKDIEEEKSNSSNSSNSSNPFNPWSFAASNGDIQMVKTLMRFSTSGIFELDQDAKFPIDKAREAQCDEIVKLLHPASVLHFYLKNATRIEFIRLNSLLTDIKNYKETDLQKVLNLPVALAEDGPHNHPLIYIMYKDNGNALLLRSILKHWSEYIELTETQYQEVHAVLDGKGRSILQHYKNTLLKLDDSLDPMEVDDAKEYGTENQWGNDSSNQTFDEPPPVVPTNLNAGIIPAQLPYHSLPQFPLALVGSISHFATVSLLQNANQRTTVAGNKRSSDDANLVTEVIPAKRMKEESGEESEEKKPDIIKKFTTRYFSSAALLKSYIERVGCDCNAVDRGREYSSYV